MAYVDNILLSIYALSMQEVIAHFLKAKRIAAGKSQSEVALEVFNDSRRQSDISAIENGGRLPDLPTLIKLGGVLIFSLSDIQDAVSSNEAAPTPPVCPAPTEASEVQPT